MPSAPLEHPDRPSPLEHPDRPPLGDPNRPPREDPDRPPAGEMPPAPRLRTGQHRASRPSRASRRRSLTREAIVEAALRVIDAEGLDAMTMRRVGEELGTGGASLYGHVAGKEELLELVIDRVIGELELPGAPDPDRWEEQVKEGVRSMRATLGAHKDLARACLARIPLGPNALRGSESLIGILKTAALPDQVIAYACDLLALYATATAYEESLYAVVSPEPEDFMRFIADMREYFAALPPERFPNIVALAGPLTAGTDSDERFEFGLDLLVRGLASHAGAGDG